MSSKRVLFLATSPKTRGGIAAVLRAYSSLPFWKDYHVRWIGTHIDRSAAWKWLYAIKSLICFLFCVWRYDLIHIHVGELPSMRRKLVFCKIAKVLGKPVIIHLHIGNQLDDYTDNAVCRQLLQQADAIITLSQNIRQKVASRFGVGDKVHVIYNPCPVVENVRYSDEHKYVLFAGTLNQNKGYSVLLTAFAKVAPDFPDWRLIIAGNGELDQAKQLAETLKVARQVEFKGWVMGDEKAKLFREASVFCLSSYAEGFPMAVLDAWSCGIPVVSTPVGGLPDVLVDGENALLFQPGDVEALAEKLHQILSLEPLRKQLSAASLALSKGLFSMQTINDQLTALYETCLNKEEDGNS